MKAVFRADASIQIGTGHIMRCLTLADELKENGAEVLFISRELPGNLIELIEKKGFTVYRLAYSPMNETKDTQAISWQIDADETKMILQLIGFPISWLIIDHYSLDVRWENQLRPFVNKIIVIDDLANRPHDCDVLLDQNLYESMDLRYDGLVPDHCQKLLGPGYGLLRPEFKETRKRLRKRNGQVRRMLIFFGGSDPTNETVKALEAVRELNRPDIAVDVIVGGSNPYRKEVKELCEQMPYVTYYSQVENMAEFVLNADLAIGAGGVTMLERYYLGLPTIVSIIALNQSETVHAAASNGVVWNLGWHEDVNSQMILDKLRELLQNSLLLKEAEEKAVHLMKCLQTEKNHPAIRIMMGN
ncbi:MAG: UDP-2,4-diacetamido-2,4,6-trideoxy-beta-L-altropyranose hydrolase [Pelotomaculum sp. PtaU1.Bin035]|nr:MAG: UDP-2,4-diacetamido-2,4,6-trideoxy-beta-L-altropyranose hydrolase [Pelotomaculum sp. PtaU1.Bin035]